MTFYKLELAPKVFPDVCSCHLTKIVSTHIRIFWQNGSFWFS